MYMMYGRKLANVDKWGFVENSEEKELFDKQLHKYPISFDEENKRFNTKDPHMFLYITNSGDLLTIFIHEEKYENKINYAHVVLKPDESIDCHMQLWVNTVLEFAKQYPGYEEVGKYIKEVSTGIEEDFRRQLGDIPLDSVKKIDKIISGPNDAEWDIGKEDGRIDGYFNKNTGTLTIWDYSIDIEEADQDFPIDISFSIIRTLKKDSMVWKWLDRLYDVSVQSGSRQYRNYKSFYENLKNLIRHYDSKGIPTCSTSQ